MQTSELQFYLQYKPANFKLICSMNQQISTLFAVQTSEFQTYLQHEPANFKLICCTNQQISNLFAVQTSEFQTYLEHEPANFRLLCTKRGILSTTQRSGVLSLIPKENKLPHYLKNWRPLTLLNCDYKIFAKAIANRILKVLTNIISSDQNGF